MPRRSARSGLFVVALAVLSTSACSPRYIAVTGIAAGVGAAVLSEPDASGPEKGPYFYRNRDYGTDAIAGPVDMMLNKGYATAQWEGRGRNVFDYPYGWSGVVRSLTDPFGAIEQSGGFARWFRDEFIPFSDDDWKSWNWAPNYGGHILEGGIGYRRLREWYEARGVGRAGLAAAATTWVAAFVNEAYELPTYERYSGSTFADLAIFDVAGMLLFESDRVAGAFARTLGANVWPSQGAFTAPDGLLINNGNSVILKFPILVAANPRVFLRAGIGFQGGLTFRVADATDLSVSVGKESRLRYIDRYHEERAEFGWAGGLWLDREGSLMAALQIDQHTDRLLALNVYPGVLEVAGGRVGGWFVLNRDHDPFIGLSFRRAMGLGVGVGF